MAFLGGGGSGDAAVTVLELAGLGSYTSGQQAIARNWRDASNAQDSYSASAGRMENIGVSLAAGGGAVAASAILMGRSFVTAAGNMQATEAGFKTMLGSADAAKAKIAELQNFAATTPFDFTASAKSAQKLLAMGVAADDLIPTMKAVGNAVAAAGGGTEEFQGVLTAIGQIRAKGKVSSEELMQMAERGVPALKILQREFNLTADQMENIGKHVTADQALAALNKAFNQDFGGALEEQAKGFNGVLSNFGDSLEQFKTSAGESLLPMATEGIKKLTSLAEAAKHFVDLHPQFSRFALTFMAVGGSVGVLAGMLLKLRGNALMAAAAKKILTTETIKDDIAEKAKAITAGAEGDAIGGVGKKATDTAGKLGALARVRAFLGKGIMPAGAASSLNNFAFSNFALKNPLVGNIASRAAGLTAGGAMVGGALGVGAGVGVHNDLKALGASEAQAVAAGAFTGVGAAAIAMFVPGGAVAVALTLGVRQLMTSVSRQQEAEAEAGNGLDPETEKKLPGMTRQQKADEYFKLAEKKETEARGIDNNLFSTAAAREHADELRTEAETFRRHAQTQLNVAQKQDPIDESKRWQEEQMKKHRRNGFSVLDQTSGGQRDPATAGKDNGAFVGDYSSTPDDAQGRDFNSRIANAQGGSGGSNLSVNGGRSRNGDESYLLKVERDPNYDLNTRLKRHNTLNTQFDN